MRRILLATLALVSSTSVIAKPAVPAVPAAGDRYVALGSSFAAGPGVGPNTPGTPARCGRGTLNYPNLLAREFGLDLVDATCSGATTQHVLGPWNEIAPQIDSVDAATRLVTITIGGNDIAFVGNIFAAVCEQTTTPDPRCQKWREMSEEEWAGDEERMRRIVRTIRDRAPKARIVFVDYISVLPLAKDCSALPISADRLRQSRAAAKRLAGITARVARTEKAEVLKFSALSRDHAPCSAVPWSNGTTAPEGDGIPIHPNRVGHVAAAKALGEFLRTK